MGMENYRMLAGLIAAHPHGRIAGRTRLQKEVKLLQRIGFPTDYNYMIHFYGPYSEGLQADVCLLEAFGMVNETSNVSREGNPYYILQAGTSAALPDVSQFQDKINLLDGESTVVLELAATYDAFREAGANHEEAVMRLHRKKGVKCDGGNEEKAMELLKSLGLETN